MLIVEKITVSRFGVVILKDLSFSLGKGEGLLIEGDNGSGKTTLALALAGDERVKIESGKISWQGEEITRLGAAERFRKGIFLALQELPRLEGVSFLLLATAMLKARFGEAVSQTITRDCLDVLGRVGLGADFLEKPLFCEASGGQKKRLELAFALLACPNLVIFDEIEAGMDLEARKILLEVYQELRGKGAAQLWISHDPNFLMTNDSEIKTLRIGLL